MGWIKWFLVFAAIGYAGLVVLLYVTQRSLIYHPDRTRLSPQEAGLPAADEVVLDTSDGEKVIVWHVPPGPGRKLVVYFHGNAEILPWRVERHRALIADGTGLVALSYRGYAGSTGSPSEEGLARDAIAAYRFAAARYAANRITLWGHSLGSGVAVRLAAEQPVARLILEAPFASAVDIAAAMFPFAPVRLLMRDQFRSDARIGRVAAPVLIMHGVRDQVIPIAAGERLYGLVRAPKRLVRFPAGDHDNLDEFGAVAVVHEFLEAAIE
jgi:fermentation-respiration switch protein FrsA (DUF1100 family)